MKSKQLSLYDEIIVDNFAGGGGASCGIELAIGRPVDIAINHDPDAIAMHKANHPETLHFQESVWDVDPKGITLGQPVGLAWFSPDCKHFSKAKGGKPVEKKIRGLAWIVLKWAGLVRPRVIILENVEEFQTWGPIRKGKPIKSKKGQTFRKWLSQLEELGYKVETKELKACDFGAPTIRKRFFLVARCDGQPIVWPEPTHGQNLKPYRSASEIIEWSIPCPSIFNRNKALAINTQKRIATGLDKFVLKNADPFVIPIGYGEKKNQKPRTQDINKPISTVVSSCKQYLVSPTVTSLGHTSQNERSADIQSPLRTIVSKAEHCLTTPFLAQYHTEQNSKEVRGQTLDKPIMTLDSSPRYANVSPIIAPFISKAYAGESRSTASNIEEGVHTITARQVHQLAAPTISKFYGNDIGSDINRPLSTVVQSDKNALQINFIDKYYGTSESNDIQNPLNTITTKDRFSLISVRIEKYSSGCDLKNWPHVRNLLNTYCGYELKEDEILLLNINGVDHYISDIGLRMLTPRELYNAQGFPEEYIIDFDCTGRTYPKTKQVARCGNSVPPPFAEALVRANVSDLCVKREEITKYAVV